MEASSTPRITCAYLNTYVGRNVMVVGKVQQLRGDEAIIDADGNVTAHLNRVRNPPSPSLAYLARLREKHPALFSVENEYKSVFINPPFRFFPFIDLVISPDQRPLM